MKRRNEAETMRFFGSHWFWMKIGSTPTLRAFAIRFETRSTAGAIICRFLPMRSNKPFGEQKSCWMSIITSAV